MQLDQASLLPLRNERTLETKLFQYGFAMLANLRDRAHCRLHALQTNWRPKRLDRSDRRRHVAPAIVRFELRVTQVVRYGVNSRVRDVRRLEALDRLG